MSLVVGQLMVTRTTMRELGLSGLFDIPQPRAYYEEVAISTRDNSRS